MTIKLSPEQRAEIQNNLDRYHGIRAEWKEATVTTRGSKEFCESIFDIKHITDQFPEHVALLLSSEQALQGELKRITTQRDGILKKFDELVSSEQAWREQFIQAVEVLKWYAEEQYGSVRFFPPIPDIPILHDFGQRARDFLSSLETEENRC